MDSQQFSLLERWFKKADNEILLVSEKSEKGLEEVRNLALEHRDIKIIVGNEKDNSGLVGKVDTMGNNVDDLVRFKIQTKTRNQVIYTLAGLLITALGFMIPLLIKLSKALQIINELAS